MSVLWLGSAGADASEADDAANLQTEAVEVSEPQESWSFDFQAATRCPAGGEHDIHPLEVIPAEGELDHDVDGACIKCGADGYPVYIAPVFCRCGAEITHSGYGWCSAGCPDE